MKKPNDFSRIFLNTVFFFGILNISATTHAQTVTSRLGVQNQNATTFLLTNTTTSGHDAWCATYANPTAAIPCYGELPPGNTQWAMLGSPTAWLQFDYDVCDGGIDYSSTKPKCRNYVGHFGLQFTANSVNLNAVDGGTATLSPYVNENTPRTVEFVSSGPSYSYPKIPSQYAQMPYRGVNLAGADYDYSFALPSLNDGAFYAAQGMNTVRLPFKWEYLQSNSTDIKARANDSTLAIDFNQPNAKAYANLVNSLTAKGLNVIVDMHNYMRYGTNQDIIGGGGRVTTQDYANAWAALAMQFKDNTHVSFDLMNEPHDIPTELILMNYNAAIAAIRNAGAPNLILLEGNHWSNSEHWTESMDGYLANSAVFVPAAIEDPLNNYALSVHQYFDSNASGTGQCVPNALPNLANFNQYLRDNKLSAIVTELGGNNTRDCASDINNFLTQLPSDGSYLGFTGWAGGQNARDLFTYFGPSTLTMTDGFQPHLIVPSKGF